MNNDNIVGFCESNQPGIEFVRGNYPQRISGLGHDHKPGLFRQTQVKMLQIRKVSIFL